MNFKLKLAAALCFIAVLVSCADKGLKSEQVQVEAHQPNLPVLAKKERNPILEIALEVKDSALNEVTAFVVDLEGTTELSDLKDLELLYVPQDSSETRPEPVPFGKAPGIDQEVRIEGNLPLEPGIHRFVLVGSLNEIPELTNNVQARLKSVEFGEQVLTPVVTQESNPQRIGIALRQKHQDDAHSYRIPGLATTNKGTLIAVYDNRYEHSGDLQAHVDVGMSRSTDGGQSWEPMKVIMDMNEYGGRPEDENGIGDPAVLVDKETNTIWVAALWISGNKGERAWNASGPGMDPEETGQFMLVKSEDDGVTWSEPINVTKQMKKPEWRLFFNGPGKGISMKDGTLVFAAQFRDAEGVPHSTIVYSKDKGETWHVGTGAKSNTTEAQVVELADGSLMLNMRDNRNHPNNANHDGLHGRSVAITRDLGETWEEHPTSRKALPESTCMASIISASLPEHGEVLFFSNPNSTDDRSKMTIKASTDQGMTWPEEYQLELYENDGFGYSCMTMIDENHIGILYEGSRDLYFEKVHISEIFDNK